MKTAFKQSGEPYIFGLNWKDTAQKQKQWHLTENNYQYISL